VIDDFKIYITTLNEENLIGYTIEALLKVFPAHQISVIDLGSQDATLDHIPGGIEVLKEEFPEGKGAAGRFFTKMKADYSQAQEWVLWVDGDEIYPTSSLLKMKSWLEAAIAGEHDDKGLRLYWRILDSVAGRIYCSTEYLSAGPKLFNSNYFSFKRAWPQEVIYPLSEDTPPVSDKNAFNGIWFWHGVLLRRSSIYDTARIKKLGAKRGKYEQHLSWTTIDPPWDVDYAAVVEPEWTVVNMSTLQGDYDTKWRGRLE